MLDAEQVKQTVQQQIRSGRSLFQITAEVVDVTRPNPDGMGKLTIQTTDHEGKHPQTIKGMYSIFTGGVRVSFSWKSKDTFFCPSLDTQG